MKPSGGQYGGDPGSSLPRYAQQHGASVPTTNPLLTHTAYLNTQNQSMPAIHSTFSSMGSQGPGSSPRSARDYHPHHLHGAEIPGGLQVAHRGHMTNPQGIGMAPGPGHASMHMSQRRRTSGQRLSLLWDIAAGERDRGDRSESSGPQMLQHPYAGSASGAPSHSHAISGSNLYSGRPNISMMSSMGGMHSAPKPLLSGSLQSQSPSATPPRYNPSPGVQSSRPTSSNQLHQFQGVTSSFLHSGHSAVKPELGTLVKEEAGLSKSPLQSYYSQTMHSQALLGHQSQHPGASSSSIKTEVNDKDVEIMPSKEVLLQSMDKVDKEINKVSNEIKGLERKKHQLENAAKKPPQTEKSASPKKVEPKHRDLWQVIYAENKKKAEAARGMLDRLGQRYDMPLYNQPCDTKVYQDNLKKNEEMRPKLLAYFQRRSHLSNIREQYLSTRYDQLMEVWQKKTEKIENNVKRKAKEAKVREFFEKQFPEIRKVREQQERFSVTGIRSGTRGDACRSEADFNEIVDGLTEQEHHEQHMRQLAVVPPMLLDRDERRLKFINNNGLVTDPVEDYKKRQNLEHWNAQEKQIFKEKFIQHPKSFNIIASFLEKKTVADCVLFYYLSKKSVGYKGLVRKNSLKPRKVKSGRGQSQQANSITSGLDQNKSGQLSSDKNLLDKDLDQKRESPETTVKEEEVERIERPPSPRITRSRNKNLNWTDEDIATAKEGFAKHGKDFAAISRLFASKAEHQIKNFYHNYKKKHNLDQLITDSKKKKTNEGTRRTRILAPTTESIAMSPEDASNIDEGRPKSTDSQVTSSESAEPGKKQRKKETDIEKKDDIIQDDFKKTESISTTVSTSTEAVTSTSTTTRVTTPVSNLLSTQIRTRRSAASVTGAEGARSESTKRASESSPVDEPVDKKMKKSKTTKESKIEQKETDVSTEENKTDVGAATKLQDSPAELEITQIEKQAKDPDPPIAVKVETTSHQMVEVSKSISTQPVSHPPMTSQQASITSATVIPFAPIVTSAAAQTMKDAKPAPALTKPQPAVLHPLPSHVKGTRENDGDSSATCSADEEPNMQDVDGNRAVVRKHADSPYAFEDDSSASIKLESKRPPMHSTSVTKSEIQVSSAPKPLIIVPPANVGRPSSTHPPPVQVMPLQLDNKRPQSQPPPLGVMSHTNVPISALSFQPSLMQKPPHTATGNARPSSTPGAASFLPRSTPVPAWTLQTKSNHAGGGHIVGMVPHPSEFLSALQNVYVAPPMATHTVNMAQQQTGRKNTRPPSNEISQTIDLTVSATDSAAENDLRYKKPSLGKDSAGLRLPQYHPVPHEATCLQKDFVSHKMDVKPKDEVPVFRPHNYTASDIATAIPVSSLRAPMPGPSQGRDMSRSEHSIIRRDINPAGIGVAGKTGLETGLHHRTGEYTQPMLIQSGLHQPAATPQVMSLGRPSLTTSSIPTKFVSGSITTGAPVLQKQRPKQSGPDLMESRKSEVLPHGQLIHPGDQTHAVRLIDNRGYPGPDMYKRPGPDSRSSMGKNTTDIRDSVAGHVTTIKTLDGRQEQRGEVRTNIIPGREIVVQPASRASILHEQCAARQEAMRNFHPSMRFPAPVLHPSTVANLAKSAQSPGSILAGTPVKRRPSEDSNSSLSPAASYPGIVVSRPSPTLLPPSTKQPDRKILHGSSRFPIESMIHPAYQQHMGELQKREDLFHGHRRTPDKNIEREQQSSRSSGVTSPSHRRTPTGLLSQHPAIKQETPSSPHPAEELLRRNPALGNMIHMDPHHFVAAAAGGNFANPALLRMPGLPGLSQFPLNMGNPSNRDILDLYRQYGSRLTNPTGQVVYPLYPPGMPGYPLGFMHPTVSTIAPGSPQIDDGRETTKNMLNQDFLTAQLMQQGKPMPGAVTAGTLGFPLAGTHTMTTPGLAGSPLIVSGASSYHPLATPYHPGGLPVGRLNFIPGHPGLTRNPFPAHYQSQVSRITHEGSRSPIPKPTNAASPEPLRQRHRSGEASREFANHPAIKERNSPISPMGYHSPRGSISPRDRFTPQGSGYQQQSPSHPSQWPAKSYHPYPHSSTPPSQSSLPYQLSKSPHYPQMHHPGAEALNAPNRPDSRSSPYMGKHSRTGSLDATAHSRLDRARPDSAGPHPRSLPQSPNVSEPKASQDYSPHIRRDTHSPIYRQEKRLIQPSQIAAHETAKMQSKQDERGQVHRQSPRPMPKQAPERAEARLLQTYAAEASQPRQKSRSPYPVAQAPKEVQGPQYIKEMSHSQMERNPTHGHENIEHATSNNPGEDLRKSGRAKMKAATLIDHIINLTYHPRNDEKQQSTTVESTPITKPTQSKQTSDPVQSRVVEKAHSPRPTSNVKQDPQAHARYEAESKAIAATVAAFAANPYAYHYAQSQHRPASPGGGQLDKMKQPPSVTRGMTFGEHSADVINECYRTQGSERTASPNVVAPSPHSSRSNSGSIVTEPISPPERHSAVSKPETNPTPQPYQQYHKQIPRYPGPTTTTIQANPQRAGPESRDPSATQRPVSTQQTSMSAPSPTIHQQQAPPQATVGSSLVDLIRKTLLNNDGPSTDSQGLPEQPMTMGFPCDMIFRHAMVSSSARPVSQPAAPAAQPKPRKDSTAQQSQGGSGKYMSALMFSQMSATAPQQNAPQQPERSQQFYQSGVPRTSNPASSPAPPPEPAVQQRHQAPIKYESLSDSD